MLPGQRTRVDRLKPGDENHAPDAVHEIGKEVEERVFRDLDPEADKQNSQSHRVA